MAKDRFEAGADKYQMFVWVQWPVSSLQQLPLSWAYEVCMRAMRYSAVVIVDASNAF